MTTMLPVADAAKLGRAAARVRRLRLLLAAAAVLLLAVAVLLAARSPGPGPAVAAEGGPSTEIVLDVSGSVADSSSRTTGRALTRLAHSGRRFGLILFSDSAQETLPPGTPASELRPFAHALAQGSPKSESGVPYHQPVHYSNPWRPSFKGGTMISAGLVAARRAMRRDHVRGSVLLISDLGDPLSDRKAVRRELLAFDRAGIGVKILELPYALRTDVRWFERVEGPAGFDRPLPVVHSSSPTKAPAGLGFPLGLAAAAALLAFVLGTDQLVGRSLRWGAKQ